MAASLIDKIMNLPKNNRGGFLSTLTDSQAKEYTNAINAVAALPKDNRPSMTDLRKLFLQEFKQAPSTETIRRAIERAEAQCQ